MKIGFSASIDVTKIDKAKLVKGEKGTYLNITCFFDPHNKDKYDNNGMITQSVSKEERESGNRGAILGNTKVFFVEDGDSQSIENKDVKSIDEMEDDIPW